MATGKKPRKKYDNKKHLKHPISIHEHMSNIVMLEEIKKHLEDNTLTMSHFNHLIALHRLTFYDNYLSDVDVSCIRGIVERIFVKKIIPRARLAEDGTYKCVMSDPLPIHHMQRNYLRAFIISHIEALVKTTDRRKYALALYHGIHNHKNILHVYSR